MIKTILLIQADPGDMFSDMMDLFLNLGVDTYVASAIMAVIVIAVTGALLRMLAR